MVRTTALSATNASDSWATRHRSTLRHGDPFRRIASTHGATPSRHPRSLARAGKCARAKSADSATGDGSGAAADVWRRRKIQSIWDVWDTPRVLVRSDEKAPADVWEDGQLRPKPFPRRRAPIQARDIIQGEGGGRGGLGRSPTLSRGRTLCGAHVNVARWGFGIATSSRADRVGSGSRLARREGKGIHALGFSSGSMEPKKRV